MEDCRLWCLSGACSNSYWYCPSISTTQPIKTVAWSISCRCVLDSHHSPFLLIASPSARYEMIIAANSSHYKLCWWRQSAHLWESRTSLSLPLFVSVKSVNSDAYDENTKQAEVCVHADEEINLQLIKACKRLCLRAGKHSSGFVDQELTILHYLGACQTLVLFVRTSSLPCWKFVARTFK